jgi:predicted hydrolase (HD superfamily)
MSAMMELTNAIIQPDCDVKVSNLRQWKSRFRKGSYNANSKRGQRERVAKDVAHAELLAPAAISAIVVIHLLVEVWVKACVAGHQVLL